MVFSWLRKVRVGERRAPAELTHRRSTTLRTALIFQFEMMKRKKTLIARWLHCRERIVKG